MFWNNEMDVWQQSEYYSSRMELWMLRSGGESCRGSSKDGLARYQGPVMVVTREGAFLGY